VVRRVVVVRHVGVACGIADSTVPAGNHPDLMSIQAAIGAENAR